MLKTRKVFDVFNFGLISKRIKLFSCLMLCATICLFLESIFAWLSFKIIEKPFDIHTVEKRFFSLNAEQTLLISHRVIDYL